MDHDVTLWQQGVQHEDEQKEVGPITQLFNATVAAFSALLHVMADNPGQYDDGLVFYNTLRDEFQKFYVWNESFPSSLGELDLILSCSKNLRAAVLDLMVQWAKVVCRIPKVLSGYAWSRALPKFEELEVLAEKIGQVAEAATKDVNVQYSLTTFNGDFSSDSGSDSSSYMSLGNFEDVVDDLKVYSGSLMDLTPSLENPASDFINVEESKLTLTEDLLNVVEPARPFVLIIKDRFPSANAGLVKKLGEANWQRRERLVKKLAENERMSILPLSGSDTTSAAGTVVGRSHHQAANDGSPRTSIVRSSMSFASNFQSITTASNFSEPSIFDSNSAYMPIRQQRLSVAESFTSFATSVAEGVDNGQRRLPSLPSDHDFDTSFKCKICGDMLRNISGRADWKKHVYSDLEPYICLFKDCSLGLHTFQSQREWMVHEFTAHRTEASWRCNLCAETFHAQEQFRAHVDSIHNQDFVPSQISEVVTASKRLEAGDGSGEVCPFCLVIPAKTQKAFARHVGRHLQVISLAALPVSEEPTDSDSDNDNDENEKDNDSNEDYDSAGSNESHETAKQPSQSDGLEEIHDIIEQPSQPVGSNESHETTEQSSQSVKQVQNRITVDQRSNKAILSEALQNANTAVLLDNAQNFEGAIRSYSMACDSLDQVKARSSDTEDIRKLNAIRNTYARRVAELEKIIPDFVGGEKVLTKRPQSSANDDDNDDDASQSSIEIDEIEDDFLEYLERPRGDVVEAVAGNLASIDAAASEPSEQAGAFLYLAASLFEFNSAKIPEAGYSYLSYLEGETFEVIAERGSLWLARNQDDPSQRIGWINSDYFIRLPTE